MELYITEIDDLTNYEQIPENMPPKNSVPKINVVKQTDISQNINQNIKPFMSGPKAKMVRPVVPPEKPKISYDDILNKMGMFVANGKLHLLDNQAQIPKKQVTQVKQVEQKEQVNNMQNSYIYNKYFQNDQYNQTQEKRPLTPLEYRNMLINNIIQKHKIRQMKSTKLIMPNSNINISSAGPRGDLNKLFGFSQK